MKKLLLIVMMALLAIPVFAQTEGKSETVVNQKTSTYTRGKGFLARPELYGGLFLNGGYQLNPYVQVSLGAGITIDPVFVVHGGARVYTGVKKWAGMFDYHAGFCNYSGIMILRHCIYNLKNEMYGSLK